MAFGISFHTLRLPSLYIYLHSLGGEAMEGGGGWFHTLRSQSLYIYLFGNIYFGTVL